MPLRSHHGVGPEVHPSAFVAEGALVIGAVKIEEDASVWFNAVLRGDINRITVGKRSNVQDAAVVHVTHEYPVTIEHDVTIGHGAIIHGCIIESCSLIGMGAVILDNARVGRCAIVAAGAVVREDAVVPEGTLVAGVPARVVRPVTEAERRQLLESAGHYVRYARSYIPE
jgi:gamma-carbonic anhydrase